MKKYLLALGSLGLAAVVPAIASAQNLTQLKGTADQAGGVVQSLTNDINYVIPFMIALAVIFFIWYVIQYVIRTGPGEKADAKKGMIWSVVAIAIIVLLFGLVKLLGTLFGIQSGGLTTNGLGAPGVSGTTVSQ